MVFGGLALLFLPIVYGVAAIIFGVVAITKKEKLAPVGIAVGILGMVLGMFLIELVGMAVLS